MSHHPFRGSLKGMVVRVDGPATIHDPFGDFGDRVPAGRSAFCIISDRLTHGWGARRLPGKFERNFLSYEGPFGPIDRRGRYVLLLGEDEEKVPAYEFSPDENERAVFYAARGIAME